MMTRITVTEPIVEDHGTSLAGNFHNFNQECLLQDDFPADREMVSVRRDDVPVGFGGTSSFLHVEGLILI